MRNKKITVKAIVDLVVWVHEDNLGNKEIIDIEDVLEVYEFQDIYTHEEIEY